MKKFKKMLCLAGLALTGLALVACSGKTEETANKESSTELSGEITMWHSFTQGPRLESIQKSADEFMKKHPHFEAYTSSNVKFNASTDALPKK